MTSRARQKDEPVATRTRRPGSGVVQRSASANAPSPARTLQQRLGNHGTQAFVRETAGRGIRGGGGALPFAEAIQQSFGRHDVGDVHAFVGGDAAGAAAEIGAAAYTVGNAVAFHSQPNLHLAAHEAAHVVQQRLGVSAPGGVGSAGDAYEQNAEAVAARVVAGHSAEDLLDRSTGANADAPAVQRYAFVKETQVMTPDKSFTPTMKTMLTDTTVRNYDSTDEFKKHAAKQTDYLGNLTDGTWIRFNDSGSNLLGEEHDYLPFENVIPYVGSKSFIYEPFSADVLPEKSNIRSAYEQEIQPIAAPLGVDKEKDKTQFGAESLFPKIGFGFTLGLQYFDGSMPVTDLEAPNYFGQPLQRYLKIAWAYSKDNKATVDGLLKNKKAVLPKLKALANVHATVAAKLDPFITALPVNGYLGDAFKKKPADAALLPLLAKFAVAVIDAMVERAATEKSSRLSEADRKKLQSQSITASEKIALFSDWRDFLFEDNVKAAISRGVRYAGMGLEHLKALKTKSLPSSAHVFDMARAGKEIAGFKNLTKKLEAAAKKP